MLCCSRLLFVLSRKATSITDLGLKFLHHVVGHSALTLAGTAIGVLAGIAGLWNPLTGGFVGAVASFLVSLAFEDSDDGLNVLQRIGLLVVGAVVMAVVLRLTE
jgi:hypothetical protein